MDGASLVFITIMVIGGWILFGVGYQMGMKRGRELQQNDNAKRAEKNQRGKYDIDL